MSRVEKKLKSERGASITFALLLFLVCAVVSSIVIVAATATSGRMSKLAENDQRYYAVTSAAEMLKKMLDGQAIIVEREINTEYTYEDTSSNMGNPRSIGEPKELNDTVTYSWKGDDSTETETYNKWFLTRVAYQYAETTDETKDFPLGVNYGLVFDGYSELDCDIYVEMTKENIISFTIKNPVGTGMVGKQNTLYLSFKVDTGAPVKGSKTVKGDIESLSGGGYRRIDTKTETTTTTVMLHFLDITMDRPIAPTVTPGAG